MMEWNTVVQNRRSIRKFTEKAVEREKITALLESARLCQSAKNRQPWRFLILEDGNKDAVADMMLTLFEQRDYPLPGYANSSRHTAKVIKNAPVLILVFRYPNEDWLISDTLSIGAAVEHICLQAVELGLGALWIRDTEYTKEEICALVGYPQLELVCAVAIGYPDEFPAPRPRKPLQEFVLEEISQKGKTQLS